MELTVVCSVREAYTTCGYTPFLSFQVADLQDSVQRLLQLGATLDGPIKYPEKGKVTILEVGICDNYYCPDCKASISPACTCT